MKKFLFLLLILNQTLFSQTELYLPRNFAAAYSKETRSYNGCPGQKYWQNRPEYKIKAELFPAERLISGEETIVYYNDSPDTLKQIILKLLPDLYRSGNARDFEISPNAVTKGTEILDLTVAGNEIKQDGSKNSPKKEGTNLFIPLSAPLIPQSKIEVNLKWSFTLPNESQIRMGAYDSTSFFVAYWYPQMAVYDDIDGWDVQNYTGTTESYNDFGNYQVELTVPKGFLLFSTGELKNPLEVYSDKIFRKYRTALESEKIINVVEKNDYLKGSVTVAKEKIIYKIGALNVPDFAFGTSDHYLWDASTLTVDSISGKRVLVSAVYNRNTKDFSNVAAIARKAIKSFSTFIPGVPYPYPAMTVFNGQGGMEFPMMCNNSAVPDLQGTVHLTSHEISHTYFPFYMGINERKYAWMDEGWATMLPFDFQTENAPGYDPRSRNALGYSEFAGYDTDIPPMVPAYNLKNPAYRTASYRRPGAAYQFLRQYLGDKVFLEALHLYMSRWNGKHPVPYDFFFSFNEAAKEKLDWFWKPWFFESKYPDLSIKDFKIENGNASCEVKNKGGLPLPVLLTAYFDDGTDEIVFSQGPGIWKNGNKSVFVNFNTGKKLLKLELGTSQIPDTDKSDNLIIIK
jgi:Peptidase family M1 domain